MLSHPTCLSRVSVGVSNLALVAALAALSCIIIENLWHKIPSAIMSFVFINFLDNYSWHIWVCQRQFQLCYQRKLPNFHSFYMLSDSSTCTFAQLMLKHFIFLRDGFRPVDFFRSSLIPCFKRFPPREILGGHSRHWARALLAASISPRPFSPHATWRGARALYPGIFHHIFFSHPSLDIRVRVLRKLSGLVCQLISWFCRLENFLIPRADFVWGVHRDCELQVKFVSLHPCVLCHICGIIFRVYDFYTGPRKELIKWTLNFVGRSSSWTFTD